MKSLTILLALTFSVMFASTSYAGWKKVVTSASGDTFYVDFERIRKHDGYVYFWELIDRLKPTESGYLSSKAYIQADYNLFRNKNLSYVHHKQPMGRDTGDSNSPKNPEWQYPHPNSANENVLKFLCSR